jgi:2'-5' RNA ligase
MILAYVVVLLFDRDSEEKILKICSEICGHSGTFMLDSCSKPHITIAICEEIDEQTFYAGLESFAGNRDKFNLRFESIGIFTFKNITLFLSPVITDSLLNIHKEIYTFFTEEKICSTPTEQYLPNKWVPHCTLAVDMTPDESIKAIKSLICNFQALDVRIEYIGIAEYSPDSEKPVIKTFELGKQKAGAEPGNTQKTVLEGGTT